VKWTGVRLADVLKKAEIDPGVAHIRLAGADAPQMPTVPAFLRSIPLDRALDPNTLLAYRMNGEPLSLAHGAPIRLIVPGWSGNHWVKWLTDIRAQKEEAEGYYMRTAYRMPKNPVPPGTTVPPEETIPVTFFPVKSLIGRPADGAKVKVGPQEVVGVALSGDAPITKVEVSTDGGATWAEAKLEGDAAPGVWQVFRHKFTAKSPGTFQAVARATDARGSAQPENAVWNPSGFLEWLAPDELHGGIMSARWIGLALALASLTSGCEGDKVAAPAPEARSAAPPASSAPMAAASAAKAAASANEGQPVPLTLTAAQEKAAQTDIQNDCIPCHSEEMLAQQRLTPKQWDKVLKRMKEWGSRLEASTMDEMVAYLSTRYGPSAPPFEPKEVPAAAALSPLEKQPDGPFAFKKGDAKKGEALYKEACAVCHGEGKSPGGAGGGARGTARGFVLADRPILYPKRSAPDARVPRVQGRGYRGPARLPPPLNPIRQLEGPGPPGLFWSQRNAVVLHSPVKRAVEPSLPAGSAVTIELSNPMFDSAKPRNSHIS
jgi:DMSO/TMAO reductase YedYZ molybdopterin-dependent catalytic subunit/cytochrome c2